MQNTVIDESLGLSQRYVSGEDADGAVANLLARALLIVICGEFEKDLRRIVVDRCDTVDDEAVHGYIVSYTGSILRSLRLREVRRFLGRFGSKCKDAFDSRVGDDDEAKDGYTSLVEARHAAAHGGSVTLTVGDVRRYYGRAKFVLDYFSDALAEADGT